MARVGHDARAVGAFERAAPRCRSGSWASRRGGHPPEARVVVVVDGRARDPPEPMAPCMRHDRQRDPLRQGRRRSLDVGHQRGQLVESALVRGDVARGIGPPARKARALASSPHSRGTRARRRRHGPGDGVEIRLSAGRDGAGHPPPGTPATAARLTAYTAADVPEQDPGSRGRGQERPAARWTAAGRATGVPARATGVVPAMAGRTRQSSPRSPSSSPPWPPEVFDADAPAALAAAFSAACRSAAALSCARRDWAPRSCVCTRPQALRGRIELALERARARRVVGHVPVRRGDRGAHRRDLGRGRVQLARQRRDAVALRRRIDGDRVDAHRRRVERRGGCPPGGGDLHRSDRRAPPRRPSGRPRRDAVRAGPAGRAIPRTSAFLRCDEGRRRPLGE